MKKLFALLLALFTSVSVCSCSAQSLETEYASTFEAVSLRVGEDAYIKVNKEDENLYRSDDESVVTVSSTGVGYLCVKALGVGVAEISMGTGTVYRIGVNRAVLNAFDIDGVSGNTLEINLFENENRAISVDGISKNLSVDYQFEIADKSTAIVGANGTIRAKKEGVTTLIVTRKTDGLARKINVVVTGDRSAQYANEVYASTEVVRDRHIQGVASDGFADYVVYGGTEQVVKIDKAGNLVGTIDFSGSAHVGDVGYDDETGLYFAMASQGKGATASLGDQNPANPDCYTRNAFVYIFDAEKITRENMTPAEADVQVCYIGRPIIGIACQPGYGPYADYLYTTAGNGKYGIYNTCDSCTVGPKLGGSDGESYLTFAGGSGAKSTTYTVQKQELDGTYVYESDGVTPKMVSITRGHRIDNDYLVLMQIKIDTVLNYARPYAELDTVGGPTELDNIAFFRYGYHDYGIQTLTYDSYENVYMASCYGITNVKDENGDAYGEQFPTYKWFAIDATNGSEQELIGTGGERGLVMNAKYGKLDEASGIRGWRIDTVMGFSSDTGMISMGNGYVYLSDSGKYDDGNGGSVFDHRLILCKWGSDAAKNGEGSFGMTIVG